MCDLTDATTAAKTYTNLGAAEISLGSNSKSVSLPDEDYFIEQAERARLEILHKRFKQKTEAWSRNAKMGEERLREELEEREQEHEREERRLKLKAKQYARSKGRKKLTKRERKRRAKEIAVEKQAEAAAREDMAEAAEQATRARARVRDTNFAVAAAAREAEKAMAAAKTVSDIDVKKVVGDYLGSQGITREKAPQFYGWQLL